MESMTGWKGQEIEKAKMTCKDLLSDALIPAPPDFPHFTSKKGEFMKETLANGRARGETRAA